MLPISPVSGMRDSAQACRPPRTPGHGGNQRSIGSADSLGLHWVRGGQWICAQTAASLRMGAQISSVI